MNGGFDWKLLIGMIILVAGTLWYISEDRKKVEEELEIAYRKKHELEFNNDENNSLLLEDDEQKEQWKGNRSNLCFLREK